MMMLMTMMTTTTTTTRRRMMMMRMMRRRTTTMMMTMRSRRRRRRMLKMSIHNSESNPLESHPLTHGKFLRSTMRRVLVHVHVSTQFNFITMVYVE